ncbi:double zinc ribbon domain-containing protein [Roseobacteraceae bacterium NS-SX3]
MLLARFQTAVSLIYPPQCLGCGVLVEDDFGLCGHCWRETHFIAGTVCEGCGTPLPGEADGFRIECDGCMAQPRPWSAGRAALLYQGKAREMVLALKHGDRTDLAGPAAGWLRRAAAPLLQGNPAVVPVPLHWTRLMRRRYNQSALLAGSLARQAQLEYWPGLLRRHRQTPSLDGRSREERFAILGQAISVYPRRQKQLAGRKVLLVDDVMTSGATLTACTDACLQAGAAEVRVAVLARVTRV